MKELSSKFWSFSRARDAALIPKVEIVWKGPFSWKGFEHANKLTQLPDLAGVYLFTFEYKDGYILRSAGVTKSMKSRFAQHTLEFKKGKYTILDVESAKVGERKELWHGWEYARQHRDEFVEHKDFIMKALEQELAATRLFVTEIGEVRIRERIEFSIIQNAYVSKEPWSDLVDGGMALRGRFNNEVPIEVSNICSSKIYGLPESLEI